MGSPGSQWGNTARCSARAGAGLPSVPPICPNRIMPWWVDRNHRLRELRTRYRCSHLVADIALHFVNRWHHRFQYSASHVVVQDAHGFTLSWQYSGSAQYIQWLLPSPCFLIFSKGEFAINSFFLNLITFEFPSIAWLQHR